MRLFLLVVCWFFLFSCTFCFAANGCTEGDIRHYIEHATSGSVVSFPCPTGTVVVLSKPLWISKNLTIDGKGITLDGQGKTRHIVVANRDTKRGIIAKDLKLTLKNINLINGGGGDIFQNSRPNWGKPVDRLVAKRDGGSIYLGRGGTLVLENVVFSGNIATGVPTDGIKPPDDVTVNGGAVYGSFNAKIRIVNCKFFGNTAGQDGGAVFVQGGDKGNAFLSVRNAVFVDNVAGNSFQGGGGAIKVGQNARVEIDSTVFIANTAKREGGALFLGWGNESAKVKNTTFSGNLSEAVGEAGGGAIKVHGSPLVVTKSTFVGNRAHNGGAIFVMLSPLTVQDSVFFDNHAEYRVLDPQSPEYKRLQKTDMKNAIFGNGGVLYQDGSNNKKPGVLRRERNSAKSNTAAHLGGALVICAYGKWKQKAIIRESTFFANSANDFGGAIQGQCRGEIIVSSSRFTANTVQAKEKRKQEGKHIGVYKDTKLVQNGNVFE